MRDVNGDEIKVGDTLDACGEHANPVHGWLVEGIARNGMLTLSNGTARTHSFHGNLWRRVNPPILDASGREIRVGDVLGWAPHFSTDSDRYTVVALHEDRDRVHRPGAVRVVDERGRDNWFRGDSLHEDVLVLDPAPKIPDGPAGNLAVPDPCDETCIRCRARTRGHANGAGDGPYCRLCIAEFEAAPAPVCCAECRVALASLKVWQRNGKKTCVYCYTRDGHEFTGREHPESGITAASEPEPYDDGDVFALPSAEWP